MQCQRNGCWVLVQEQYISYHSEESRLFTVDPYDGNLTNFLTDKNPGSWVCTPPPKICMRTSARHGSHRKIAMAIRIIHHEST